MSLFIDNEFNKVKHRYDLHSPKQLVSDAGIQLLDLDLDYDPVGFSV